MRTPVDYSMYFDKCRECGDQMRSGHRSGTCSKCRTTVCAEPGCGASVRKNVNAVVYCKQHSSRRKSKKGPLSKDYGVTGI